MNRPAISKQLFPVICGMLPLLLFCSCAKSKAVPNESPRVTIATPGGEPGYIYVDGNYTGTMAPDVLTLTKGDHVIGIALQNSMIYLRKTLAVSSDTSLQYTLADRPAPKMWKALWVGIHSVTGTINNVQQQATFTNDELDSCYGFFNRSIANDFVPYSYGTMSWQVTRQDIQTPVALTAGSSGFIVDDASVRNLVQGITPGNYDCVFVCWKQKDGAVDFGSNTGALGFPYFGLTETDPMSAPFKTGYVQVRFTQDPYTNLADKIHHYENTDPGVWIHEWLHSVAEHYYENKGLRLPQPAGDGLVVHAAQNYGYSAPWMSWYRDLLSGRVPANGGGAYLGIGPEALLKCTVRETATGCAN